MNDAENVITAIGLSELESSKEFVDNLDHELQEFTGNRKACTAIVNSIEIFIDDDSSETLTVDEKWRIVLDVVLKHVILEPYVHLDFAVSTFAHFLYDKSFQAAITRRLERQIADCMLLTLTDEENNGQVDQLRYEEMDDRSKIRNFCQLISRLLITSWPSQNRGFGRQRNALTYAGITAVHTWLDCIEKTTKNKSENGDDFDALEVCSYCLVQLVKNTGRKLWLSWPDLADRIYSVIKLIIISNDRLIPERLKERLLSTYVQINDFPKSTKSIVKTRHAYTQTYQNAAKNGVGSSVFNFTDFSKMLPETSYHRNGSSSDRENRYFRSYGSNYYRRYGN